MRLFEGHALRGQLPASLLAVPAVLLSSALLAPAAWAGAAGPGDTRPDPYDFMDVAGVPTGTLTTSNTIVVSGIDTATPISIEGGSYSIEGAAFTTAAGMVVNGNRVRLQVRSAAGPATLRSARVMIGDVGDAFMVTTGDLDTTAFPFRFAEQTGVAPGSLRYSEAVRIEGINGPVPVSIKGGAYRINGGDYTMVDGMANPGDVLQVRQQASFMPYTTARTGINVGTLHAAFVSMTNGDDVNPDPMTFHTMPYVPVGAPVESEVITPMGYDAPSPVKAYTGTEYRILPAPGAAGGAAGGAVPYTTADGWIRPGESLQVRNMSSPRFGTLRGTTLQVGNVRAIAWSETTKEECDVPAELNAEGRPVLPPEAFDVEPPVVVDDNGSVAMLYPDMDTSTDAFEEHLPCSPSIGGTLPPPPPPDTPEQAELNDFLAKSGSEEASNELLEQLRSNPIPPEPIDSFANSVCYEGVGRNRVRKKCDDPLFLDSSQPFEGRDIIYVHGLDTSDLTDRIQLPHGDASQEWPHDPTAFLSPAGYFRQKAVATWANHIQENLQSGWQWTPGDGSVAGVYVPKANRYLIIAYSTGQRLAYSQHALLTQIQHAMVNGENVVTPSSYPVQHVRPFCANGCIIISHSTGSPLVSTAMALADFGVYGPGGKQIVKHVAAHVSIAGAISGSSVATLSYAVATAAAAAAAIPTLACQLLDELMPPPQNICSQNFAPVLTSVLVDLLPPIMHGLWGEVIDSSPVPTVTFAGGHPIGTGAGATQLIQSGVADGVVNMDSACGNPHLVFAYLTPPDGFLAYSMVKAFEFSEDAARLTRGTFLFLNQLHLQIIRQGIYSNFPANYLAGSCSPALNAAGMVMPVLTSFPGLPLDSRARYRNHYSFMQSLAEHSYSGGGSPSDYFPSFLGNPPGDLRHYKPFPTSDVNAEETRAVTDASIYTRLIDVNGTHLAKPLDLDERVRGRKIQFKLPKFIHAAGCHAVSGHTWQTCQRWVWKRTYHLADRWQYKQDTHYVYEYIGRR